MLLLYSSLLKGEEAKIVMTGGEVLLKALSQLQRKKKHLLRLTIFACLVDKEKSMKVS